MNNVIRFASIGLLSVACGGQSMSHSDNMDPAGGDVDPVEYPEHPVAGDPPFAAGGNGGSGSSAGKGGSAHAGEASSASGNRGSLKDLLVKPLSPSDETVYATGQDQLLFPFSLTAPNETLNIQESEFKLSCTDELAYRGSAGTDYIRDIRMNDLETGETVMGPIALPAAPAELQDLKLTLEGSFPVQQGKTRILGITADFSLTEDAPGELFSKSCRIIFAPAAIHAQRQGSHGEAGLPTGSFLTQWDVGGINPMEGIWMNIQLSPPCVGCPAGPQ